MILDHSHPQNNPHRPIPDPEQREHQQWLDCLRRLRDGVPPHPPRAAAVALARLIRAHPTILGPAIADAMGDLLSDAVALAAEVAVHSPNPEDRS